MTTNESGNVPPNALSELFDCFAQLSNLLQRIIEADDTPYSFDEPSPLVEWYLAVTDVAFGKGLSASTTSFEAQHKVRNPFSITEYRGVHGDGTQVTDFQTVSVESIPDPQRKPLVAIGAIDTSTPVKLPIASETETALPVLVTTENDLRCAFKLLVTFHPRPPAASTDHKQSEPTAAGADTEAPRESDTTAGSTAVLERIMDEVSLSEINNGTED